MSLLRPPLQSVMCSFCLACLLLQSQLRPVYLRQTFTPKALSSQLPPLSFNESTRSAGVGGSGCDACGGKPRMRPAGSGGVDCLSGQVVFSQSINNTWWPACSLEQDASKLFGSIQCEDNNSMLQRSGHLLSGEGEVNWWAWGGKEELQVIWAKRYSRISSKPKFASSLLKRVYIG